jgi:2-oxoglutarate ferredoxin oxidoreductase subunit gamma
MNQPSLDKFFADVVPGGVVIVDSTMVPNVPERDDVRIFRVAATKLAEEAGLKGLGNVILVGKLYAETEFCDRETLDAAIRKSVSAKRQNLVEANLKAIEIGMQT